MVRLFCIIWFGCSLHQSFATTKTPTGYHLYISDIIGDGFLVPKKSPAIPEKLEQNQTLDSQLPFSLVTSVESFLEVSSDSPKNPFTLRLGQSTGLEVRSSNNYFLFKGTVLVADLGENLWSFESDLSQVRLYGSGTFIIESTTVGFKVIILEGTFRFETDNSEEYVIQSGDLVLVTDKEGQISQSLQIELPLLLNSSRLVNIFSQKLATHSRLISAAQVQVMRMKINMMLLREGLVIKEN